MPARPAPAACGPAHGELLELRYADPKVAIRTIGGHDDAHTEEMIAYLGYHAGAFPQSEEASQHVLALPVFPQMTEEQQKMVVDSTAQFFAEKS